MELAILGLNIILGLIAVIAITLFLLLVFWVLFMIVMIPYVTIKELIHSFKTRND